MWEKLGFRPPLSKNPGYGPGYLHTKIKEVRREGRKKKGRKKHWKKLRKEESL